MLRHLQADPLLPADLLPADWPGAELRHLRRIGRPIPGDIAGLEPARLTGAIANVGPVPDICQALIIDAPPEAVFDAINSAAGNRAFWTDQTE